MSTQKVFPSKPQSSKFTNGKEISHIISQFSISAEVQTILKENQKNMKNVKIVVKNGQISLKIVYPETHSQSLVKYSTTETSRLAGRIHIFKQFSSTILKDLGSVTQSSVQSGSVTTLSLSRSPDQAAHLSTPTTTNSGGAFSSRIKVIDSPPFSKSPTPLSISKPTSSSSSSASSSSSSAYSAPVLAKSKLKPQQLKRLKIYLAMGPHSLKDLSGRMKISTPEVSNIIDSIGQTYNPNRQFPKLRYLRQAKQTIEDLYVLKYSLYQDLRLDDFPNTLSSEDMKVVRRTFEVIYNDVLKLDQKDPARVQLRPSKPPSPLSNPPSSSGSSSGSHHRTLSNSQSRTTSSPSLTNGLESRKRKLATTTDQDVDYFRDLAERFQTKYKEYETLYHSLNNNNNNHANNQTNNLEKLFEMHKTLEGWKSQLWKSVENAN